MRSLDEQPGSLEGTPYRELRLLEEVGATPDLSQRTLAHRLGVALGMANLLLRHLARKGYIRVTRVGPRRWAYALTPAGIARKLQLAIAYVEGFLDHYRRVRLLLREDLGALALDSESRVAIYGRGELAELVFLALKDMGVTRISVFDQHGHDSPFLGMPVHPLKGIVPGDYVKVVVAESGDVDARCRELWSVGVPREQTVTLLGRRPRKGHSDSTRTQRKGKP